MKYIRHTTTKLAQQHIRDKARLLLEADTKNIGQRTRRPQREKSRISSQSNEPKPHVPGKAADQYSLRGVDRCGINTAQRVVVDRRRGTCT